MGRTRRERRKCQITDKSQTVNGQIDIVNLYKFLSSKGWRNESQLKVAKFSEFGRGLYSKVVVRADDILLELPINSLISYQTLENDLEFLDIFDEEKFEGAKSEIIFQCLLAFYLCHQKLKEESEWEAYIKSLPESFSHPYFCSKLELQYLPDYILQKIVEQNGLIKTQYQKLMALLHVDLGISLDLFKWAFFVCNSRSVYIKGKILEALITENHFRDLIKDLPNMALAPFLDFFNHSDDAKVTSQLSHAESAIQRNAEKIKTGEVQLTYQIYTQEQIRKRQQIFINYGALNNTKLLIEYGFFLPNHKSDFLEFSLNDINSYIKSHLEHRLLLIPRHKYKFIQDHDLDNQLYIDLIDGISHNFQAILAMLLVQENLYNLTEVAFGDAIQFVGIQKYAVEIIERRRSEYELFIKGLKQLESLSDGGKVCLAHFQSCITFTEKVLEFVKTIN